ncbi:hypothetical protein Taro_032002 [Colocasia esculenta]|uniref:Cellulose synthase-like protein G3 n=1 Tax=Colocasia esculenta TaxID=4460 RepID=A0A843VK88_COLES|nr:hypothetical protein [Colocasia esculenta]
MAASEGAGQKPATVLNTAEVDPLVHLNRAHAVVYSCALLALLYHRALSILDSPTLPSSLLLLALTFADLVLAFMWALAQAFRWRPVRRREFPERLAGAAGRREEDWPALDVFICTADPYKEPPVSVVNTALSAMAFDYPAQKVSVYVSDDAGSQLTLFAFMEAARFAGHWLPFCRDQGIADRCPEAYFGSPAATGGHDDEIKIMYQRMKGRIEGVLEKGSIDAEYVVSEEEVEIFKKWETGFSRQEHPSIIQVLLESSKDVDISGHPLPNLIYVSREKSKTSPHHFKAGALNVLIRVSGVMTNAPMVLTSDCDMYSNDPEAPKRALCYLLDPSMSSKLAYVQFPQRFRGINKHDIYGGELKHLYQIHPQGMDGFQGPYYLGSANFFSRTCFYYSSPPSPASPDLTSSNGCSTESHNNSIRSDMVLKKAHEVASCSYEKGTKWGSTLGIRYGSLSEDHHTGYHLHCKGWVSVFCDPPRPAFLGDVPITLNDVLSQNKRWSIGLLQVAFSKCSPLTLGVREGSLPMAMCYARYAYWASWCIPMSIYAVLPQIALAYQVPLFPKVSNRWFYLYAYLFLTAYAQDCVEFIRAQGTIRMWWNDQRMWMIRGVTSNLFGVIQFFLEKVGISGFGFNVTSKVIDDKQTQRYEGGSFDFGAESSFFVSLGTIATVNLVSLVVGIARSWTQGAIQDMAIQVLISGFVVVNCWPIYEASVLRGDEGRVPAKVIRSSVLFAGALFSVAYFVFSV